MAHAYYVVTSTEEGIVEAADFVERALGLSPQDPDVVILRHQLFSVADARRVAEIATASSFGKSKAIIVSMTRLFHEAQNALLKLFEEPPEGVLLIMVIPAEGILLPTLRSRLAALPGKGGDVSPSRAREFLAASPEEREKLVARIIDRSKSDRDEEKQSARSEAVALAEDLMRAAAGARRKGDETPEIRLFLEDLARFLPLLHTRSAPLKLIFEHLLLVIPKSLEKRKV